MNRRGLLAAPLLLAACSSILPKQKYIPRVLWPLEPPPPGANFDNSGKIVLLRDLNAGPGMSDQAIQTLNADGSLTASYYNQWAVAPADAASQALQAWLTASGAFSAVISPGSRLSPDLIVEGALTELVSDLARNEARATLTLVVIADSDGNTRPLAQRRIIGTAPLAGSDYGAEVRAQTAALASALAQSVALVTRFSA